MDGGVGIGGVVGGSACGVGVFIWQSSVCMVVYLGLGLCSLCVNVWGGGSRGLVLL